MLTLEASPTGAAMAHAAKKLERIIGENFMLNIERRLLLRMRERESNCCTEGC